MGVVMDSRQIKTTSLANAAWLITVLFQIVGCSSDITYIPPTPEITIRQAAPDTEAIDLLAMTDKGSWNLERDTGLHYAADLVTEYNFQMTVINYDDLSYSEIFTAMAQKKEAPNILFVRHERELRSLANSGYFSPLRHCPEQYQSQFETIEPSLWSLATWNHEVWAMPVALRATPLFFNKVKLKALGWSDEAIAALPSKIEQGQFTLDDMLTTAQQAIEQEVVEPGFGYWHYIVPEFEWWQTYPSYDKLRLNNNGQVVLHQTDLLQWFTFWQRLGQQNLTHVVPSEPDVAWRDRLIWDDGIATGRVLFWATDIQHWVRWARLFTLDGRDDTLMKFTGIASYPSHSRGVPSRTAMNTAFYALVSPNFTPQNRVSPSCALLAQLISPAVLTQQGQFAYRLGVTKDILTYQTYRDHPVLAQTHPLLNHHATIIWSGDIHPRAWSVQNELLGLLFPLEQGDLSPEEALAFVLSKAETDWAEVLIIEE